MPRLARLIRPLILSLLAVSALAQAAEPARPRIGLVLGGGGFAAWWFLLRGKKAS